VKLRLELSVPIRLVAPYRLPKDDTPQLTPAFHPLELGRFCAQETSLNTRGCRIESGLLHETPRRSRKLGLSSDRLLSRRRSDGIDKQLSDGARLQSKGSRTVRGCMQEVRARRHNHLHNIVHAKGRTLSTRR